MNKEKSRCLLYIKLLAKSIFITCGLKSDEDNDKEDELYFHLCILNWWMSWKGLKFLRRRWYRGQSRFQSLSQTDSVFRISTRLAPEREVQCQAKLSIWRYLFFSFFNVIFCIFIFCIFLPFFVCDESLQSTSAWKRSTMASVKLPICFYLYLCVCILYLYFLFCISVLRTGRGLAPEREVEWPVKLSICRYLFHRRLNIATTAPKLTSPQIKLD